MTGASARTAAPVLAGRWHGAVGPGRSIDRRFRLLSWSFLGRRVSQCASFWLCGVCAGCFSAAGRLYRSPGSRLVVSGDRAVSRRAGYTVSCLPAQRQRTVPPALYGARPASRLHGGERAGAGERARAATQRHCLAHSPACEVESVSAYLVPNYLLPMLVATRVKSGLINSSWLHRS